MSAHLQVGTTLPPLSVPPISRTTLALFAGASGDHNPIHIDLDVARSAGLGDVFAHGMLSMAYLGQAVRSWAPQERLRRWSVRFTAITPLHAVVTCRGEVVELFEEDGERRARLKIGAWTSTNLQTLDGEAVIAIA